MLKTIGLLDLAPKELGTNEVIGGGGKADETVVDLSKSSKSRKIVKKSEKPQRPEKLQRSLVQRNLSTNKHYLFLEQKSYVSYESLNTSFREKTSCRSTLFRIWWWWSKRSILTLYQRKPLEEEPRVKWWGDGWLDAVRPDSWDVNISFYQAFLASELHRSRCLVVTMQESKV